jgi:putative SOS response-associated peptidase YedK|tara:strand:+ start:755 stop:907 length:153 start_codon:yes stop_codon:yes gene_type:complete
MPNQIDLWLNGPWEVAKSLAVPFEGDLKTIAVSADVGKVANNHIGLLGPI